jgi:hypothetical protein
LNSSDPAADLRIEAASTPLIRLLLAMAAEWKQIAAQIEALGNSATEAIASGPGRLAIQDFQAFDLLHQRASGQAGLLAKLSRKLAEDQYFDRKRVGELIADIPFESVRAGLEAAFEGRTAAHAPESDEVVWL